ncbi:MAG: hypothetical protein SCK28_15855 [Bacillota bacterium]|nr:hypothetical protein [Bacillota bacterium]
MTIKSLDFQVVMPKVQKVAKEINNLRQQDPNNQQFLAQQVQKQQAEDKSRVKQSEKAEHKRIKEKQSKNGQGKNHHHQNEKEKKEAMRLGKKIDIKV